MVGRGEIGIGERDSKGRWGGHYGGMSKGLRKGGMAGRGVGGSGEHLGA